MEKNLNSAVTKDTEKETRQQGRNAATAREDAGTGRGLPRGETGDGGRGRGGEAGRGERDGGDGGGKEAVATKATMALRGQALECGRTGWLEETGCRAQLPR